MRFPQGQKRPLDPPPELKLQAVVGCLIWVLGTAVRSPGRAVVLLVADHLSSDSGLSSISETVSCLDCRRAWPRATLSLTSANPSTELGRQSLSLGEQREGSHGSDSQQTFNKGIMSAAGSELLCTSLPSSGAQHSLLTPSSVLVDPFTTSSKQAA